MFTRSPRSPSLDRCDSLPVISVMPPVAGKQSQRPDYTALFTGVTTANGNIPNKVYSQNKNENLNKNSARLPKPFTAHMRAGSAPALMPTEEIDRLRRLHGTSHDTKSVPGNQEESPPPPPLPPQSSGRGGRGRASPFGGRLVPASSEGELTKPPPPKPSRIPSVKYKQKPRVVIRRPAQMEEDDRDYSDYFQAREEPSWIHGDTESAPKFREDHPKRLSPSPLAAASSQASPAASPAPPAPQLDRRANRLVRDGKGSQTSFSTSEQPYSSQQKPHPPLSLPLISSPVMRNVYHRAHPTEAKTGLETAGLFHPQ